MANWLDQHPVVGRPQEPKKEREQDWLAAFPVVDAPPRQQRESQATLGDYVRAVDSGLGRGIASLSAGLGQFLQAPVAGLASGLAGTAAAIDRGRVAAKEAVGIDAEPARQTQAMAQRMAQVAEDTRTRRAQQTWALSARLGRGLEQVSAQSLAELRERDAQHAELAQQRANLQQAQGLMGTLGAVRDNPLAFTHTLAQSLPATLAGVGAGAIAARSGAGLGTVGTVGIASEAGLGAAQARYGVYEQVSTMPREQLQHSPRFVEILAATGGDGVRAHSIFANELADQVPVLAGAGTALGTVLTNRLFGGDATAKALTGGARVTLPETAKRIAQEAVEEGIQSVPEALASHGAMVQADPSQDFDLGGTVAQGMAAGLAMGAGGHGARYAMDRRAVPAEPPADETALVEPPPAPAPIEPAQAQPAAPPPPEAQQALLQPVTITALDRAQVIADELDALEQQAVQTGTTPDTDARQQQLERELTAITGTWPAAVPGAPTRFSTEAGVSIDARYALIDASDLITSHALDLRANPLYPQELQPRDRTRAASELQVSKIAQGLDPQRLGSSGDATSGAPIIGADGLVESGNARTIAIKRAYQAGGQKIEDYKGWLRDHASEFGLDPQAVDTLTQPVLVRVRQTPVNRAEFAKQANMSQIQRMSASEQALSDAARLVSLDGLDPADDGDFSSSRDFISQFMALLPTTEQAEMLEADGKLSTTGYRRIQNAVLAKAYGDSPTLRRMTESMDDNLRNVSKALVRVAPVIAETRGRMQAGALHEADIVPDLLQAVEGMAEMKDRGVGLEQELSQQDLSGPKYTAESQTLLRMLSDNIRSPRRIAEFLQHYHAALEQAGDPRQGDMLGPAPAPTRAALLSAAAQQGVPNDTTTDAQRGEHRASPPTAQPDRQQPEDAPGSRSSDQGDGIASTDAAGGQPGVETGAASAANEQSAAATGQPAAQQVAPAKPAPRKRAAKGKAAPAAPARTITADGQASDGQPIKPGDVFTTQSGRTTTPYPTAKGPKQASQWLINNALLEAEARGESPTAVQRIKPGKGGSLSDPDLATLTGVLFDGRPVADAAPALTYTPASQIDSPTQGVLANAKERKARAFARLKAVRQQVKDGTANRLDLLKAESAHKDAVREVEAAEAQLERDANRLGLTTAQQEAAEPAGPAAPAEAEAGRPAETERFPSVETITGLSVGPGGIITPRVIAPGRPLYRETNSDGLDDILRLDGQAHVAGYFVTDNQDLALGQGDNRGAQVVFRPDALSGREHRKPGTGDIAGREYKTDIVAPRAVQSVTMKAADAKRLRGLTRRVLLSEFDRQDIGSGLMRFQRKGLPAQQEAAEPDAAYNATYETDLFGNPVPAPAGSRRRGRQTAAQGGGVQPAAAVQGDTPAPAGDYYARTVVGKSADRRLGTDRILAPQDAAQATAYLYRSAVERFDAIVTDKDGKPLAVVGNFKGAVSQTSVYPATVVGEAVRVPGAARIWFSHNHPSGVASLSSSDKALNQTLADVFRGSGIEPMGILAVTGDRFAFSGADGSTSTGEIPAPKKGVTVPVIERALKPASADRQQIENTQAALQMAGDLYKAAGSPGVMILDAQHRLAAWMPLPPVTRGNLRDTGGLNALYRGVSESNAGAAILVHGGELDARVGDGSVTASQNIAAALTKVDVRVLDSINAVTRESVAETVRTPEKGPVFSRTPATDRPAPQGPATVEMVQQVVDAITPAWAQRPEIVIAQSMQDPAVPESVRNEDAAQRKRGATGVPSGFYYQGKVYLIADGLSSPRSVVETLYHEALGHHGLRSVFGDSLDGILDQIALARPELMRAKAKQYGKANTLAEARAMVLKARPDLAGAALDSAAASRLQKHRREVAEEVLAEMAQTRPELGIVKRAIAAIRTWLRANLPGFEGMSHLSDAEIARDYLLPARDWVERGADSQSVQEALEAAFLRFAMKSPSANMDRGSNAFAVTGYEIEPDASRAGRATTAPTQPAASRTRDGLGSGPLAPGDTDPSLGRATRGDSTVRGGTAGAGDGAIMPRSDVGGNDDVRFSRSPATLGSNIPAWSAPEKAKWDDFVYKIQDRHVDLKRVTAQIKEVSGAIDDAKDTYLREEMYHSRVAKRIQDFINDELNPLVEDMRRTGVTMKAIERFMQARHAPEANAVIAQRNPGVPDLQDGGSGMTNAEAQAHMASLKPAERKHLESAAAKIDAIIKQTRQTLVDYELETQAVVDSWAQLFPNYVPLFREGHDDSFAPGIAQGFGVRGRETQSRTGSTAEVKDIFANVMMQRERAITRGEKNRVGQSLVALAESNPNADWWQVDSAPTKRVYDHKLGVVVNKPDLRWKERPNAVVVKFKNKAGLIVERAVVFSDKNERAKRMAAAMKSLDLDPLQGVMGIMASVTRYFAMINTQYNPVFGPFNMLRDIKAAMIQVDGTPIEKDRGKILSGIVPAIAGIYLSARKERKGKHQHGIWAGRWDEFQKVGGPTGFRAMFETSEDRAHDIRATMNPDWWTQEWWGKAITVGGILEGPLKPAKRGMVWVLDWLSDYNLAIENGVRLAAYQAAIDRGQSKERAASLAKNLTVNFNRRGQVGLQAGALYAFFNSAIQGTARMGETLTQMEPGKPKSLRLNSWGRKVVYGGLLLGAMQALAMAAAGFDDEDPPQFIRDRSLIIPLGNGRFWSQPLPLGYHVIPAIGRSITEFVLGGFQDPEERVMHVMELMLNAFNPLGHSGLSIQTIAPTPIDPLVALGENRDWTGRQIAQKSMNPATPGTEMASDQTMVLWRWMAAAINRLTGGNEFVAGGISPNPDQFSYLFGQITGGVGREAERAWQTGAAIVTGDEVATHRIPMVGRFVGSTRQQASKAATFRGHVQELNRLETEIRGLREAGRMDEARALRDSRPEARLITAANSTETRIRTLRNKRSELIQAGASREEVRSMNERITAEMLRFNEAMAKLKQPEQELVGE